MQDIEAIARQLQQYQEHMAQLQNFLNPSSVPVPSIEPPKTVQVSAVDDQLSLLGKLYEEFLTKDEGKALAAGLTKFARYVQSRVAQHEANS